MKKIFAVLAGMLISTVGSFAAVINFDSTAPGSYSVLNYGPVSITYGGGSGTFEVTGGTPNDGFADGNALLSWFTNPGPAPFIVTFAGGTSSVSISVTDFVPSDDDLVFLEAYSAADVLLDSDTFLIPESGPGRVLSVSSIVPIAYVKFYETDSFAGAVYWDYLTYESRSTPEVPEPSTVILVGAGLLGTTLFRRMRNAQQNA